MFADQTFTFDLNWLNNFQLTWTHGIIFYAIFVICTAFVGARAFLKSCVREDGTLMTNGNDFPPELGAVLLFLTAAIWAPFWVLYRILSAGIVKR